jgi:protein phosphatase
VLAVLADGMGGLANGGIASAVAIRAFLQSYTGKLPDDDVPSALLRAFHEANAAVLAVAREAGGGTGTTWWRRWSNQGALYWVPPATAACTTAATAEPGR